MQCDLEKYEAALQSFRQARTVAETLLQAKPEVPEYRSVLGTVFGDQGSALVRMQRPAEAADCFREAIREQRSAFAAILQSMLFRRLLTDHYENLARVLHQLGQPAEAASLTLEQQKLWPTDAGRLYCMAAELAQCIPLVGTGKTALTPAEQAERRRYTDGVVQFLQQAIANGYKNADELKTAKEFEALRADEEFRKLLSEFEDKVKTTFP